MVGVRRHTWEGRGVVVASAEGVVRKPEVSLFPQTNYFSVIFSKRISVLATKEVLGADVTWR